MCVIHRLESGSEHDVKIFLQNIFPLQACKEKESEYVVYFLDYDKFQNLTSYLEALY